MDRIQNSLFIKLFDEKFFSYKINFEKSKDLSKQVKQ